MTRQAINKIQIYVLKTDSPGQFQSFDRARAIVGPAKLFQQSIIESLNQGEKIELRGFGSFRVRERGARRGRNPKTGEAVSIPAKRVPYFKPGKELKELINEDNAAEPSAHSVNDGFNPASV